MPNTIRRSHARQIQKDLLTLAGNRTPAQEGEFVFTHLSTTPTFIVLPILRLKGRGFIHHIRLHVVSKTGTNPTSFDVRLYDTSATLTAADYNGVNTIFEVLTAAVDGASDPDRIVDHVPPAAISFVTKNDDGQFQMSVTPTGAAADTDYDFVVQIDGEAAH